MCRHLSREEQREGWRAAGELLGGLDPRRLGAPAGALLARLARLLLGAAGHRA